MVDLEFHILEVKNFLKLTMFSSSLLVQGRLPGWEVFARGSVWLEHAHERKFYVGGSGKSTKLMGILVWPGHPKT